MFEFDAGKLVIIGIVALIVIGPKDLPRVLRQAGQAIAKLRRMASEFQGQFMEAMREAELTEIKEEAAKLAASTKIDAAFNPVAELKSELTRAIEDTTAPQGEGGGTVPLPVQVQTENSILAPGIRDGRTALDSLSDEPAAAQAEPAIGTNAPERLEAALPVPHPGEPGERPPLDRAAPLSRT
jgi:sec-independent protein translocase protein TatB